VSVYVLVWTFFWLVLTERATKRPS